MYLNTNEAKKKCMGNQKNLETNENKQKKFKSETHLCNSKNQKKNKLNPKLVDVKEIIKISVEIKKKIQM